MFNFKALFTATILAATATTAWGQRAEAVLYASSDCTGVEHSSFIEMSTGVCYNTGLYAGSVEVYTDGVIEVYAFFPEDNCEGSPSDFSETTDACISIPGSKSFMKVD
ncbi:hypothetical protein C8R45DRAFT_939380 [Mycena sanguinolenta]|nr:hypothetical protein C8R45DRAFT_939380 [Mycena sanguinolenta]